MYSWEIQNLMNYRNYLLYVKEYLEILDTSSQIDRCTYNCFSDDYYIRTNDSYEWNFRLRKEDKK